MKSIFTITLADNKIAFWENMKFDKIPEQDGPIPLSGKPLPTAIQHFIESYGYIVARVILKSKKRGGTKDFKVTVLFDQTVTQ